MRDVAIIGAGVSGSACARELSRYQLDICVIEKEEDVCAGTSKANSGIVHSGIDAAPGSLMAKLNVQGNQMMEELSKELDFPFRRNGSLILCFDEADRDRLMELYSHGEKNGVPCEIIEKEQLKKMEPNVSDEAVCAIYCPTGGIVCPFGLNIALAENAAVNGVEFLFNTQVLTITKIDDGFRLTTDQGDIEAKVVINAAGVHADTFHNMVSTRKIHIMPRRGEYCLLDKSAGTIVDHTIFQLPGKFGKGVLVTPTTHGNLLIGPTAIDQEDGDLTATTRDGLDEVLKKSLKSVPDLPLRSVITSFAGNRAHEDGHEFIIEESADAPGFVDVAGIESPGLTSAPAIGVMVCSIVTDILHPTKNPDFVGTRTGILNPKHLSEKQYARLIKEKPAYGNIVCRCEMVTEGEIIDAIHRPLGAKSLDGIKRRTRAGFGRCQAGFCSPKIMDILSRELGISQMDITKCGADSKLIVDVTKSSVRDEGEES